MNDMNTGAPKRPTFLTVLCILSFIAAGITIVVSGLGMGAAAAVSSGMVSDMAAQSGDPDAVAQIEEAQNALAEAGEAAGGSVTGILGMAIALSVIGLIGVIMMWKLKKTGFYVYTGAQVLGIISPMFMGGSIDFGFGAIISILFVVLYGLNLKHMS